MRKNNTVNGYYIELKAISDNIVALLVNYNEVVGCFDKRVGRIVAPDIPVDLQIQIQNLVKASFLQELNQKYKSGNAVTKKSCQMRNLIVK